MKRAVWCVFIILFVVIIKKVPLVFAAAPICEGQQCGTVNGVTKTCCGSNYACTQQFPNKYGTCVEKCGHDGDTCTQNSDCCTDLNYACDIQGSKSCYNVCYGPPAVYPTVPPIPGGWDLYQDQFPQVPFTFSSSTNGSQPFNWSSDGHFAIDAQLSQVYQACLTNPGFQNLGEYGIAIDNVHGLFPDTNNQRYEFKAYAGSHNGSVPAECASQDVTLTIGGATPLPFDKTKGTWYDFFLASFFPTSQSDHDFAHHMSGGTGSKVIQVYVGPDTWTKPVVSPPASCNLPSPTIPTPSVDPCLALQKNSYLKHLDFCHPDWQCDPNHTQNGKSLTCPTGTTCKQLYSGVANQDKTYCLYANEGENKCQHKGDLCDSNPNGRRCCNVGEDNNTDTLSCTQSSGSTDLRCEVAGPSNNGYIGDTPISPMCVNSICNTEIGQINVANGQAFVTILFRLILSLSGGIALLILIYSGYQIIMSQGNPEKIKGAKETVTAAIIGLLFIIFSMSILQIIGINVLGIFTK